VSFDDLSLILPDLVKKRLGIPTEAVSRSD
jgi:hypothetical protein